MSEDVVADVPDIEIGRYALRTFSIRDDGLWSLAKAHRWMGATCEAECRVERRGKSYFEHESPHEKCTCGIYGAVSMESLINQYEESYTNIAVIAAEGKTIIGPKGLRTAAARIVGYWCTEDVYGAYLKTCPEVQRYETPEKLAEAYGFDCDPDPLSLLHTRDYLMFDVSFLPEGLVADLTSGFKTNSISYPPKPTLIFSPPEDAPITPGGLAAIDHVKRYLGG